MKIKQKEETMEKEIVEKTLTDIFSYVLDEAKKDYESSELYKLFFENKSNVSQTAEQLIHRWDKDMLTQLGTLFSEIPKRQEIKFKIEL